MIPDRKLSKFDHMIRKKTLKWDFTDPKRRKFTWRRDSSLFERESFRSLAVLVADVRLQSLMSSCSNSSHSIIFTFSIEDEDVDAITSISEEEEEERDDDAIEGSSEKGCA